MLMIIKLISISINHINNICISIIHHSIKKWYSMDYTPPIKIYIISIVKSIKNMLILRV